MSSYCQNSTLTLTSGTAEKAVQRQWGEPVYISHLDGWSAGRAVDGRRVLHPARLPDLLAMHRLWHLQMRSRETLDEKTGGLELGCKKWKSLQTSDVYSGSELSGKGPLNPAMPQNEL